MFTSFLFFVYIVSFYFGRFGAFVHQRILLPHRYGVKLYVVVFQLQFRDFLFSLRAEGEAVGAQARDFHLAESLPDEAQFPCGGFGEVDDVAFREWPPVGHFHHHFFAVEGIPHAQQRPEGVVHVGAGHAVAVITFAVAHFPSMQLVGVIAGFSRGLLLCRQVACENRCQGAAKYELFQRHGYTVLVWPSLVVQGLFAEFFRKIRIFLRSAKQMA